MCPRACRWSSLLFASWKQIPKRLSRIDTRKARPEETHASMIRARSTTPPVSLDIFVMHPLSVLLLFVSVILSMRLVTISTFFVTIDESRNLDKLQERPDCDPFIPVDCIHHDAASTAPCSFLLPSNILVPFSTSPCFSCVFAVAVTTPSVSLRFCFPPLVWCLLPSLSLYVFTIA